VNRVLAEHYDIAGFQIFPAGNFQTFSAAPVNRAGSRPSVISLSCDARSARALNGLRIDKMRL
jgi:hypothetical protein